MKKYNCLFRNVILGVCFLFVLFLSLGNLSVVSAEESKLPVVGFWNNGLAVSDDGTYISDSWAIDETNVSEKKYVLLGQDCAEIMRVANYPEDVANGDTSPCVKYTMALSLEVSEGVSGDILVSLENEVARYTLVFSDADNYSLEKDVYPGIYKITEVEVTSDVSGVYNVSNYTEIDMTASDFSGSFTIAAGDSDDSETGATEDSAEGGDVSSDLVENVEQKNNELLHDTIKLAIAILILLAIYAVIKHRREKSEEIK